MGFFDRLFKGAPKDEPTNSETFNAELNDGLSKTRRGFMERVFGMFTGKEIDDDLYEALEEALIQGDVGVNTALELVDDLRDRERRDHLKTADQLAEAFAEGIAERLGTEPDDIGLVPGTLNIILVVGVNGVGKTTSIGKLAWRLQEKQGLKVVLGAADTFRAAASEQLKIWAQRVGCDIVAHQEGADPAAVVFDAIAAAKSRHADVLLIDTAGRLHNKVNLMNELEKIRRIIDREAPDSLRQVLLVLDATTGQNALSQAKFFSETAGVTGVILTKLDGTAKGGVVIGIRSEYELPVYYIGVGEAIDQLQPFDPESFARALFADVGQSDAEETAEATNEAANEEAEEASDGQDTL